MMGAIGTGNVRPGVVTCSLGTSGTIYACSAVPVTATSTPTTTIAVTRTPTPTPQTPTPTRTPTASGPRGPIITFFGVTRADDTLEAGLRVVCTVTGHGLKDPDWAIAGAPKPVTIAPDAQAAASALGLESN